jgi:prevent-host-death family protein
MGTWGVAEAKAKFSEVVEQARQKGPQRITRNGKLVGVMVSPEQWEARRQPLGNARTMSEFFRNSPLAGSGIDLRRSKSKPRKVSL